MSFKLYKPVKNERMSPKERDKTNNANGRSSANYKMTKLYNRHHEIIRMTVTGMTPEEISEQIGVTRSHVCNVINSDLGKEKLQMMQAVRDAGSIQTAQEIKELLPHALRRIEEAIKTGKVLTKELSGKDILKEANNAIDRIEGKPTQTIQTRNLHAHFNVNDIEAIKEKAKKLAAQGGQMVIEG